MDKNNSYFYISGALSLFLFLFFSLCFLLFITSSKEIKNFAMEKKNYISISMEIPKLETSIKKQQVAPIKEKSEKKEVLKDEKKSSADVQKTQSVEDLFRKVWTKDIGKKEKKEETPNKRLFDELQKKLKKSQKKEKDSLTRKIERMNPHATADKNKNSSSAREVNEYLAKIQALVYEYFYPPKNSQGNSVTAVIELSALGKLIDFRILSYSDNEALNRECDKIKARLEDILFPVHPDNSSGRYKIMLISKE